MNWNEIKCNFTNKWLLIEAIEAHTENNKRILDNIAVIDSFEDSSKAIKNYAKLHRENKARELYVVHASRKELDIFIQHRIGIIGPLTNYFK